MYVGEGRRFSHGSTWGRKRDVSLQRGMVEERYLSQSVLQEREPSLLGGVMRERDVSLWGGHYEGERHLSPESLWICLAYMDVIDIIVLNCIYF